MYKRQDISPKCRFCLEANETFKHLIHDCPPLRLESQNIFKDKLICDDLEWSVRDILNFSYVKSISQAIEGVIRFPELNMSFDTSTSLNGSSDEDIPPDPD